MNRAGPDTIFTTHQAARALGVSPATVVNWIDSGRLEAHRTPGGHRRIRRDDLVRFARAHALPLSRDLLVGPESRIRVLVVDDEEEFAELVREYLSVQEDGFEVGVACSGFKAGLAVARFKPHVILLDLMMPDVDGFEVFRLLREDEDTRSIPVVACTAFADRNTERRARDVGFDAFLGKPVRLETLPAVLLGVLGTGG